MVSNDFNHTPRIIEKDTRIMEEADRIIENFDPNVGISDKQRDVLRNLLQINKGNIWGAIYTIGRTPTKDDVLFIEPYINFMGDYELPSRALRTLCLWIGPPSNYIKDVVSGIKGEDWDDDFVHMCACIRLAVDVAPYVKMDDVLAAIRFTQGSNFNEIVQLECEIAIESICKH